MVSKYRSANIIIQNILECILDGTRRENGIVKSHIIRECSLKTSTAEKYLNKMEDAGYVESFHEPWGERTLIKYRIRDLGKRRYEWFVKINTELE